MKANLLYKKDDNLNRVVRLETFLRFDDIHNIRIVQIGDIFTNGSTIIPSLRIGGIQIARDFRLKPDIITYPLPDFAGQAVLPSTIDIYFNNSKVYSENLTPGPFEIKNIPVFTPQGNVKVVIRDILGNTQIIEVPFMSHPKLLKEGLTDYSFSIGALRKDYQIKSFSYGNAVSSLYYKKGLTKNLSLEIGSYIEFGKGISTGISPIYLNKYLGLITPLLGISKDFKQNKTGYTYGAGLTNKFSFINLGINYRKYTKDYFASYSVYGNISERINVFTGLRIPIIGGISGSYSLVKYTDNSKKESITVSFSKTFLKKILFYLSYSLYNEDNNSYMISTGLTIPFGNTVNVKGQYDQNNNAKRYSLLASKRGKDYYATLSYYNSDNSNRYEGRLTKDFTYFNFYGGISYSDDSLKNEPLSYRIGFSGNIAYIDGDFFFTKRTYNSFAVVKVEPPLKDVTIYRNKTPIGKTNDKGVFLIQSLTPFVPNEISASTVEADIKTVIEDNVYSFIPYREHGYLIKFKTKKVNSIRLKIKFDDGTFPPAGLKFDVDNKPIGIIGFKGKAFIENITKGRHKLKIELADGSCEIEINITDDILSKIVPYIGEYTCHIKRNTDYIIVKSGKKSKNYAEQPKPLVNKNTTKKLIDINYDNFDDYRDFLEFREELNLN